MMHTFKFDEYIYTEISFSLLASLRSCLLSMYFFLNVLLMKYLKVRFHSKTNEIRISSGLIKARLQ